MNTLMKTALLAALVTGLHGCGGGGGDSAAATEPVVAPLALDTVQGVWDTTTYSGNTLGSETQSVRTVMLKDGTAWLFLRDGTAAQNPVGIARAAVTVSGQTFSGTGKRFPLNGPATSTFSVSGSVPAADSLALSFANGAVAGSAALAPVTRFDATAALADIAGQWDVNRSNALVEITWTIGATGQLTGFSTTGCTYAGSVVPRSDALAVFTASITETCSDGVKTLQGVGMQNTDKSITTFGLVASDDTVGTIAVATRKTTP